jgi:hypothetical protein
MSRLPSPPSEEDGPLHPQSHRPREPLALNSPSRTAPIHPHLPEIRIPEGSLPSTHYDPVTCEPFNSEEIRPHLQQLRKEYPSTTAILKAQDDAVREVRQKMEEAERKRGDVQKALDKKMKEWDIEYKLLSKYQDKSSDAPP